MSFCADLQAARAIGANNYDAAIEIYRKKIEANPGDCFALSMLAHCYEWKGDLEAALEYGHKVLAQYPEDFYTLILVARCWSEKGNEEQTYSYVCRALENVPSAEPEDLPRVLYLILKLCSIFRRDRKLEARAREDEMVFRRHYKESLGWASKYKLWYEARVSNTET